jgi:uncharacterized protein
LARLQLFLIAFTILFFSACGPYSGLPRPVQSAYQRGDYHAAVAQLDKTKVKKKDRLLYFLDKGALLHYAGDYEASNKTFTKAEDLASLLETKSMTKETIATVGNETVLSYAGEKYERLLIHVFKMLNYAALSQWENALVEVRRLNTMKEKLFHGEIKEVYQNPFSLYISAVLWAIQHHYNDAYIDYKKAFHLLPDKDLLGPDILYLSWHLGGLNRSLWKKEWPHLKRKESRRQKALIVFVLESGLAPLLDSEITYFLDQKIALPILDEQKSRVTQAKIFLNNNPKPVLELKNLAQVSAMANANLPHKRKRAGLRKIAKGTLKAGAQVAVYEAITKTGGKKKSSRERSNQRITGLLAAFMVGALFNATEHADTRIWSTLPENWLAQKIELDPGEYQVTVRFYNEYGNQAGSEVTQTLQLKKRESRFMIFRRQ